MRAVSGACAVAVALAAAGCGSSGSADEGGVTVSKIVIATPEASRDPGWSQQGVRAAQAVGKQLGIPVAVAEGVADDAVTRRLRALAGEEGASLLVAHGRDWGAAAAAATRHDPVLVFGSRERLARGRVGDVEVAAEEGGYLAGYIAARASFVRSVGIVVAADDPRWYRTAGGFIAGARTFDAHVKIAYARVGTDDGDVDGSRRAARRMILDGTQMVLGLGDRSTFGVMRATHDALRAIGQPKFDAMFVDVVSDKSEADHRSLTGLAGIRWNFEGAYRQAVADLRAGRFGRRAYVLDLANGGVTIARTGRTPEDNLRAALALGERVARGEVDVPVTTTDAAVRALLRQRPGG